MADYVQGYRDGRFVPVSGAEAMPVVDPFSGRRIGRVQSCSVADVDAAVASARAGAAHWAATAPEVRAQALAALHDELAARADQIVGALAAEMGCPVWLGRLMQVPMALRGLVHAREGMAEVAWTERIGNGLLERVPAGVVAAITPWNFPLHQIVAKVAPAIAAGCSIVLKPSEVAPGSAWAFVEAVHAAGLPPGVVNLIWGGADIGDYLVRHAGIDHISFTGSTVVGRRIMAAAAERLTPLTLELGGKSACVVLDDADFASAVPAIVRSGLANSGQACVSQSRIIVPARWRDEFIDAYRQAVPEWPLGDPRDEATRLGPVATAGQHRRIGAMIDRALAQGARRVSAEPQADEALAGGYFIAPTLLADVTPDMEIVREEVFGPVVALLTYDSEEEAIALANATAYGLSGAVWSASPERAAAAARRMRTGQVVLNGAAQNLATPFGGWGASGFGRENGRFGIEELLRSRAIHLAVPL